MDSETKKKAIKDATQNGVFQANKYASNLETTKQQQENQKAAALAALAKQERENKAAMQKAAALAALARQELVNKAAMQKADAEKAATSKSQPAIFTPAKPSLWDSFTSVVKTVTAPVVDTVKSIVTPVVNAVLPKQTTGGGSEKVLYAPAKQDGDPPPPEEKDCGFLGYKCWGEWIGNNVKSWFEPKTPVSTPDISAIQTAAVQSALTQLAPTATPIFMPTSTPTVAAVLTALSIHCGRSENISMQGMLCGPDMPKLSASDYQMTVWNSTAEPGFNFLYTRYPGYLGQNAPSSENGKAQQGKDSYEATKGIPVLVNIGYSAGVEAALFSTELRDRNGLSTSALVLIGANLPNIDPANNPMGDFFTVDPDGNQVFAANFVDRVAKISQHTPVLIVDDTKQYEGLFLNEEIIEEYRNMDVKIISAYQYNSSLNQHAILDEYDWIRDETVEWLATKGIVPK